MIKERKGFSKIHLPSGVWQYKVGRGSVLIYSPEGKRFCPFITKLLGISNYAFERARWKRTGGRCSPRSRQNLHKNTL